MGAAVQEAGTQVVEWAAVEMVGAAGLAARAAAVTVAAMQGPGTLAAVESVVAVETASEVVEETGAAGPVAMAAAVTVAATRGLGIWAAVEAGVAVETVVWGSAVACAAVREAVAKAVAVQGPET